MAKGLPPWWLYLILCIGGFVAAGIYFEKAFTEGPPVRSMITAIVWLVLGLVWLFSAHRSR
jgi:hypothetical protein